MMPSLLLPDEDARTRRWVLLGLGVGLGVLLLLAFVVRPRMPYAGGDAGGVWRTHSYAEPVGFPLHLLLPVEPLPGACLVFMPSGRLELFDCAV